ncbi:MAG TPA: YciI family protein [Lachnospiraceae bacterium]|nr:YciI family protein [Lachnospiraceae bacterium]
MFLFELTYIKPLTEVETYLPEHIEYLDFHYDQGHFLCSGRKEPRTGGIILCSFKSRQEAEEVLQQDPFYINEIAKYEVTEFIPTKYAKELYSFIER